MRFKMRHSYLTIGYVSGLVVFALLALSGVFEPSILLLAHAPILLTGRNATQLTAPVLLDGRVSFAFYGVIEEPKASRYVRVAMPADSEFSMEMLVPDLPPENTIPQELLPGLTVTSPSGETTEFAATQRVAFHEPFTDTSYLTYLTDRHPAEEGVYLIRVSGDAPARFVLAVGEDDDRLYEAPGLVFGATVAANEELFSWYRTLPPPAA